MKLIALIGSRSDSKAAYFEQTFESDDYETAYQKATESLADDDCRFSVRMPSLRR